ncbi:MAG: hypothetical protein MUF64_18195 [Polyangiaceae bacterium]|jgi:hypothetical protein|nr:hypothetical protein [Polyangiaceae bacterium]
MNTRSLSLSLLSLLSLALVHCDAGETKIANPAGSAGQPQAGAGQGGSEQGGEGGSAGEGGQGGYDGKKMLGEPCEQDFDCESFACEEQSRTCTKKCSSQSDCGNDLKCVEILSGNRCMKPCFSNLDCPVNANGKSVCMSVEFTGISVICYGYPNIGGISQVGYGEMSSISKPCETDITIDSICTKFCREAGECAPHFKECVPTGSSEFDPNLKVCAH